MIAPLVLDGGVRGERVGDATLGPSVWVWVPRGGKAPSMVQAAAELRDQIDGVALRGQVSFLLDGPAEGVADGALRAACAGARAVVTLCEGPCDQAARVELDVDDPQARAIARDLGVPLLVKAPPRVDLGAPHVAYLDGREERLPAIDRPTVERARRALGSLLAALGMVDGARARPRLRTVVRKRITVARGAACGPGSAEVLCTVGQVVRAGETLAWIGRPGRGRTGLPAPASGVVLTVDRATGGPLILLGKLERTLERMAALGGAARPARLTLGWCEWVALPALGVARIKAKVDTGARSCALHVTSLSELSPGVFELETPSEGGTVRARCTVLGVATVRDSGGHAERRPVIETELALGDQVRRVRVTLTHRGDMRFPMLIGRTALAGILVDPTARFRLGR